jgi:hypothetical protein
MNLAAKSKDQQTIAANQSKTFSYNLPMATANKENLATTNLPSQPQFVSKYAQQLYLQAQQEKVAEMPMPVTASSL